MFTPSSTWTDKAIQEEQPYMIEATYAEVCPSFAPELILSWLIPCSVGSCYRGSNTMPAIG
jgi:hypothetical protein